MRAGEQGRAPLTGTVALVTGAGRGIGRAIAERLAADGARVFVNYRADARAARECAAGIAARGGQAAAVKADVTDPAAVRAMLREVKRSAKRLDILVANAGIAPVVRELRDVTVSMWKRTFDANAFGPFLCAQAAAPLLERSGRGRIVFIGSMSARLGGTMGPHYAASKAALRGLAAWLGNALGPQGVTVNVVEPGFVETALSAEFYRRPADRRARAAQVPMRRIGTPADTAAAVAFLAREEAGYITREFLGVAGGR